VAAKCNSLSDLGNFNRKNCSKQGRMVASNFSTSKLYPKKRKEKKERKAGEGLGKKRSPTQCTCNMERS